MPTKGLTVIFSSHKGKEYNDLFIDRIKNTCGISDVNVICIENNNQYSLTEAYNIGWDQYSESDRDDIIVFCHNDIHFKTLNWGKVIINNFITFHNYGIIGLAGSIELNENGIWWNDRSKCFGIVDHTDGYKEWTTQFSYEIKDIKQVAVIDGVFIAINPDKVLIDFNENVKGFHFYDITFSIENFLEGVKIGVVTNIRILHESVGMVNDQWENNRKNFVNFFKNKLPIRILK